MFIEVNAFGSIVSLNINQIIVVKNYTSSTFILMTDGEKVSIEEDYYTFMARLKSLLSKV